MTATEFKEKTYFLVTWYALYRFPLRHTLKSKCLHIGKQIKIDYRFI